MAPSGSVKSTSPRTIAGLEDISRAKLQIDRVGMNQAPAARHGHIAIVFQCDVLCPLVDVGRNMGFARNPGRCGSDLAGKTAAVTRIGARQADRKTATVPHWRFNSGATAIRR
jgi:ABC-type sugar transport system ATPase subunit